MSENSDSISHAKKRGRSASSNDSKVKIISDEDSWNTSRILKCKIVGDRAGAMVWILNHTAAYYDNLDQLTEIVLIVLTFLLGIGGIPSLVLTSDLTIVRIVNGIIQGIMLCIGLCKTIKTWYGFNTRISKHRWASSAYNSLFRDIDATLQKPANKREVYHTYYKKIQEKTFELLQKTPYVPPKIVKLYYATLGDTALSAKILFGGVQQIDIESGIVDSHIPSTRDIFAALKHSESIRHKCYKDELNRSKVILTRPKNSPKGDFNDLAKAKRVSETRRYELERYFIDY